MITAFGAKMTPEEKDKVNNAVMENYAAFLEHLGFYVTFYYHKYVIIANQAMVSVHDTFEEAYDEAIKYFSLGDFIIQECAPEEETTVTIFSLAERGQL